MVRVRYYETAEELITKTMRSFIFNHIEQIKEEKNDALREALFNELKFEFEKLKRSVDANIRTEMFIARARIEARNNLEIARDEVSMFVKNLFKKAGKSVRQ